MADWNGIPREHIPWYPTIDPAKCTGCKVCVDFCSHGTHEWDEARGKAVVANPFNCVVGCSNCSHQCAAEAISFPPLTILAEFSRGR